MGLRARSTTEAELADQLAVALAKLYMDPSPFKRAFARDADAALAAFQADPKAFGALRTYVGPLSIETNRRRVLRVLKRLVRERANCV